MCLGIPGQVVELDPDGHHLADVEVVGVRRKINVGLLEGEGLEVGDWVLIHVGFAMSKIDEAEADRALDGLRMMGPAYDEEIAAIEESMIE
ncbi:MAG TPA: HypC/HybG/HupF family hydrogenase formation chaperone [Acidimicrobiia bacterium]|nr:HypC/HybG/HupF family hydrogenase formation chaperone [Acidimicrobiia bacterium]